MSSILRNYKNSDKPVDLIFRLEEILEREGVHNLLDTIKGLKDTCLPSGKYAEKLPQQLRNSPQKLLVLWTLLLMRDDAYPGLQTVDHYVTLYAVSLQPCVDREFAASIQSWVRKAVKSHIQEGTIRTSIETLDSWKGYKEQYPKGDNPELCDFITNVMVIIYEKNQNQ